MIDYNKLANSEKYYSNLGYKRIEVPWTVSEEAKKSAPKSGNGVVTWEIGFCAGVTSYLNEYIQENNK